MAATITVSGRADQPRCSESGKCLSVPGASNGPAIGGFVDTVAEGNIVADVGLTGSGPHHEDSADRPPAPQWKRRSHAGTAPSRSCRLGGAERRQPPRRHSRVVFPGTPPNRRNAAAGDTPGQSRGSRRSCALPRWASGSGLPRLAFYARASPPRQFRAGCTRPFFCSGAPVAGFPGARKVNLSRTLGVSGRFVALKKSEWRYGGWARWA